MKIEIPRLLATIKCVGSEESFYASISIVTPDLNSTVNLSLKTVIFSISLLSSVSSNSVMAACVAVGLQVVAASPDDGLAASIVPRDAPVKLAAKTIDANFIMICVYAEFIFPIA